MKFISSTNDIRKYLGLKPKKDIKFKNISIDTRTIKKDSLFIALKGKISMEINLSKKLSHLEQLQFYAPINLILKKIMSSMFLVLGKHFQKYHRRLRLILKERKY